jgi:hypothetical protein
VQLLSANLTQCTGDNDYLRHNNPRIVAAAHHNIPSTRAHSRPYPHHEQQLYADAALGAQLYNSKCWWTCSRA